VDPKNFGAKKITGHKNRYTEINLGTSHSTPEYIKLVETVISTYLEASEKTLQIENDHKLQSQQNEKS
jgi:hypothetical protein